MVTAILSFSSICAVLVGSIWALVHFVGLQASLIWAAVVAGIAWIIKTSFEQQRERRKLLAEQKRSQYLEFLAFLNETFAISGGLADPAASLSEPERIRRLRGWSLALTITGSDKVVKAWNTVRQFGDPQTEGDEVNFEMMRAWGTLWLEMRKDCGYHNTSLTVTDVLASMLNDAETYRHLLDVPTVKK